jgi:hydroxymethylpyrimidine pyrophosphatase-like HAD family hydrolase
MDAYIFDIDGTLADNSHRTHHLQKTPKDWDSYHAGTAADGAHQHIIKVATLLEEHHAIVFCTGRHEGLRNLTENWLYEQGLPVDNGNALYMRADGDRRPDYIVKMELLERIKAAGFNPIMAFDDRNSVVEAWRANGVPCAQVAPGDF